MAQTQTVDSGLLTTEGTPIPLVGVVVEGQIRDYGARVVISQRYRNVEEQPVEAVYRFPLDEAAAVCGFEALIDGRRISGKVEEREKAFETYDDALAEGHGAYLLDEERADIFTASVGNLPPGKDVVLRITTVAELPLEGDAIRFTLPTTISPRYAPAVDRKGVGESEAERVSAPWALQVPYGLELSLDIETSTLIRSVASPTHPIDVAVKDGRATVGLATRETAMDRDLVVTVALEESFAPRALVERGPDGATYALVSLRPELETKPSPAELIFLVDRSGSMQGTSIAEVRNALSLCLRSLRPGCFFNIVGFGSSHESLFSESRPYDEESLAVAATSLGSLEANFGGTEILPALEEVLSARPQKGLPRQLFVLTDGEVSNTEAVIALARKHAGHTRIFTFGIGAGASHHLVEGLARAGEGAAEYIAPGERLEGKVMRQLERALTPALTDVRVGWGELDVTQAPHEVPPVFADGRVLLYGRFEERAKASTVTLHAASADGNVKLSLPLGTTDVPEGSLVATLWARQMIRDLEEGRSALHGRRGSRQKRALGLDDERIKAEIVGLGTTHGLVSRHTSFVAVETRDNPPEGEPRLRRVPLALTRGWHGMDEADERDVMLAEIPYAKRSACLAGPPPAAAAAWPRQKGKARREVSRASTASPMWLEEDEGPSERPIDRLVALQCVDGSWTPSKRLFEVTGLDPDDVDRLHELASRGEPTLNASREDFGRALATATALAWLVREAADSRDEWRLLAEKAREWLERMPPGTEFWLRLAETALAGVPSGSHDHR
jgi:hypothetical protein